MKILLLGKNGQVGWELQRSLAFLGEIVAPASQDTKKYFCGNLQNLEALRTTIKAVAPDLIVNAAAYTAVDKAESEKDMAFLVNALAPEVLAQSAEEIGAVLVHYSTDYVFDGSGNRAWEEADITSPLNVYGCTKLEGERRVIASGCRHFIIRTSWVYASRGSNFAKTMLRLAQDKESLSVIDDQYGAPTGADLIADVTAHIVRQTAQQSALHGVYHLTARGETTWYDYACFVLNIAHGKGVQLNVTSEAVDAVRSTTFPTPAQRPMNSRLNCEKLERVFGLELPHWKGGVERMLTEVLECER